MSDYKITATTTALTCLFAGATDTSSMNAFYITIHVLNFIAPAVWTGLLVTLGARLLHRGASVRHAWWIQWALVSTAGLVALTSGLWLTGRDGKMLSYVALVLACAAAQWALTRHSSR